MQIILASEQIQGVLYGYFVKNWLHKFKKYFLETFNSRKQMNVNPDALGKIKKHVLFFLRKKKKYLEIIKILFH